MISPYISGWENWLTYHVCHELDRPDTVVEEHLKWATGLHHVRLAVIVGFVEEGVCCIPWVRISDDLDELIDIHVREGAAGREGDVVVADLRKPSSVWHVRILEMKNYLT